MRTFHPEHALIARETRKENRDDLAKMLAKAGRYQESDEAFRRAESIAPGSPRILFARAWVYITTGRNLGLAKQLLKQYLESALTPDDPPRKEAERLLRQVSAS